MKFLPIASLALIASLTLTGCASSPSLEDQVKLIEYEKCLNLALDSNLASRERILDLATNATVEDKLRMAIIEEDAFVPYFEKNLLDKCLIYRP